MAATRLRIFVSSVQKEFLRVRADLKAFLLGDPVLRRFVSDVFLFEELPGGDRRPDDVYLEEVARCDVYLAILGNDYGSEDTEGISPVEREYNHATLLKKTRLIYVWGSKDDQRAPKMQALVKRASAGLIRRRILDATALTAEVHASLAEHLDRIGALRIPPFDTAACDGARLTNLSQTRIDWFLRKARQERKFPLRPDTAPEALLTHLNLLRDKALTNAAVLLFGEKPQRFHRVAETKCVHCHGTEYRRPFASQQIYGGDLFEQADQARDFVLSKLDRAVGTRSASTTAPAKYQLPPDAVAEAIVNALAHRDYNSNASVEVRLFADRLEIWNPGCLPGRLTVAALREDHASQPNNPLLAEPLYLTRYIEKAGSGTQAMIEDCRNAGLPEPDFEQRQGFFVATLWRDWITGAVLEGLELNARQLLAVARLKTTRVITNSAYQKLAGCPQRTATRDLNELVKKGVLTLEGVGRGARYRLATKRARNAPNAPSGETP